MPDEQAPGWPAYKYGFALFVIETDRVARLIYAGRTCRDGIRYVRFEGGRTVFTFEGNVLATNDSDKSAAVDATPEQVTIWHDAFLKAVEAGTADTTDPCAFAVMP